MEETQNQEQEQEQEQQQAPGRKVHPYPVLDADGKCGVNVFVPREHPKYVAVMDKFEAGLRSLKMTEEAYQVSQAKLWAPDSGMFISAGGVVTPQPVASGPVPQATAGLTLTQALEWLNGGHRVKRAHWLGRGAWLAQGEAWSVNQDDAAARDWMVVAE